MYVYSHPAVLNEFFNKHLLSAEECSEVATKGRWEWEDHLAQVLLTKPAEVVQKACQVLEKHGCPMRKNLKSEFHALLFDITFPLCICTCSSYGTFSSDCVPTHIVDLWY